MRSAHDLYDRVGVELESLNTLEEKSPDLDKVLTIFGNLRKDDLDIMPRNAELFCTCYICDCIKHWKRQVHQLEDTAVKFVFYIDEFTILPVLSKCTLTDVGIKEYEEHFVELNKYDDKFVVSIIRNNASGQKRELVMSSIVYAEDYVSDELLGVVIEPRSSYNSGFSLNVCAQANELKLTVYLLPFNVDSDLMVAEFAAKVLSRFTSTQVKDVGKETIEIAVTSSEGSEVGVDERHGSMSEELLSQIQKLSKDVENIWSELEDDKLMSTELSASFARTTQLENVQAKLSTVEQGSSSTNLKVNQLENVVAALRTEVEGLIQSQKINVSLATEQDEKVRNEIEMLKKELTEQNLKMPTNFTSSIVSRDSDLESNLSTSDYFKPTLPRRSSSFRSMKQILRRRLAK